MEQILKDIRDYADKAHGDQLRKYTPNRYIVHPVRVMELCQTVTMISQFSPAPYYTTFWKILQLLKRKYMISCNRCREMLKLKKR